jgi:hypothetical protein
MQPTLEVRLAAACVCVAAFSIQPACAQIDGSDDFNDNMVDPAKWSSDFVVGNGQLLETNQQWEYIVPSPNPLDVDEVERPWNLNQPTYTNDWEMFWDVNNTATPTVVGHLATIGFDVFNPGDPTDYLYVELYSSALTMLPVSRGFKAGFVVDNVDLNDASTGLADISDPSIMAGALRLVFNSNTKVFTAFADRDGPTNGYRWEKLGSFGVAGAGGSITNGNWGMTNGSMFNVAVYGYSFGLPIPGGQMHGDNFVARTSTGAAPTLVSGLSSNLFQLRWPQDAMAFELESNPVLATNGWTGVTNPPVWVNAANELDLPADGPAQFFRLRK